MVVVDTSVWVDFFNGADTPAVARLDDLLGERLIAELLQGFSTDADARRALACLEPFEFVEMAGREVALESAANFRRLRSRGVTVRKTIDMLIGTFCLKHGHELLHADRDFDVMERYLGLRTVPV